MVSGENSFKFLSSLEKYLRISFPPETDKYVYILRIFPMQLPIYFPLRLRGNFLAKVFGMVK